MAFFSLLLAALLATAPAPAKPGKVLAHSVPTGSIDACKVYGAIYLETDPARRQGCFATVYLEPNEGLADLIVFKESNKLFADQTGLWADAPNREFADYALFVTPTRGLADFTIHYTTVRIYARCKSQ